MSNTPTGKSPRDWAYRALGVGVVALAAILGFASVALAAILGFATPVLAAILLVVYLVVHLNRYRLAAILGFASVALAAAIVLLIYQDRYNTRVHTGYIPPPVLVAKQFIPKGTPGTLIARTVVYVPTTLPEKEVEADAISDPAYLSGHVSAVDIFPGQQFTATDFAASDTASSR